MRPQEGLEGVRWQQLLAGVQEFVARRVEVLDDRHGVCVYGESLTLGVPHQETRLRPETLAKTCLHSLDLGC